EREFNQAREGMGQFTVRTDVGLHFGPVISGKVGSRCGMIDFTVIGDTVNTAARIQAQAARDHAPAIFLSRNVLDNLEPKPRLETLPDITLKGKSTRLSLFRLLDA
ncbi:MAG TPA: adenylate/guanylate cyclase domain-containing protein, partial [Candidatus Ozemobacteraceae bacterium]|nr:adenylate/guanylate cyclase domain-containing protein [Candidatus Ozemobacteraceae bacterium]